MKGFVKTVVLLFAFICAAFPLLGQESAPQPDATQEAPKGKVVYQRSQDDSSVKSNAGKSGSDVTVKSEITDAERAAVTFTRYALDVRLQPEEHAIAVRAQLTVRNDSDHPLHQLPLQLSSTLDWEQVRIAPDQSKSIRCRFLQTTIDSDTDHTGALNEAAVVLPQSLAPGASLQLDVIYSGQIPQSAQRLQSIGTPADAAAHSDWDEIAPEFIGLRGFGNVVWYPVASVPVRLGDGDKLFAEIGRVKLRQAAATVSLRMTDEARTNVPNIGIVNGTVVPITVAPGTEQANVPSLVTCNLPAAPIGFQTLSLFLAERKRTTGTGVADHDVNVYSRPEEDETVAAYVTAASTVTPLMHTWLGEKPKHPLSILELPETDDAPFEERQTLYTGLQPVAAPELTAPLSHSLSHAYFASLRPWLNEGVAQFMATLWTEQSKTRDAAISQLNAMRGALALGEPGGDTEPGNTGLLHTSDAIFYRTKATYVLWMLRSMIGDQAMQAVLKAYDPAADTTDNYFEQLVARFSANSAGRSGTSGAQSPPPAARDLHWFFDDWVYHDRGLPDVSITGVYPSKASAPNSYLVAVNVSNSGGAGTEVPVTVTSGTTQVTERMMVPAHGTATRRILIQDEPVLVQVNDGVVPEVEASEHVQRIHYTQPATP